MSDPRGQSTREGLQVDGRDASGGGIIERVLRWSLQHRLLVVILWLLVALWGYSAMRNLPIDAIPDLSEQQVVVYADWMGRSPQEVEDQVTFPLTTNLQGLAGVKTVRSTSMFGFIKGSWSSITSSRSLKRSFGLFGSQNHASPRFA